MQQVEEQHYPHAPVFFKNCLQAVCSGTQYYHESYGTHGTQESIINWSRIKKLHEQPRNRNRYKLRYRRMKCPLLENPI